MLRSSALWHHLIACSTLLFLATILELAQKLPGSLVALQIGLEAKQSDGKRDGYIQVRNERNATLELHA